MKIRRRHIIWAVLALVVVALLAAALRPRPLPADFAQVVRGPLTVTLDEEGETRVRERFVISAPLAGRVLRVELEPGDTVLADETLLAHFQPEDPRLLDARSRAAAQARVKAARAAGERARAERERARATLDFQQAELRRTNRLAAEGVVSQERLEAVELAERSAAQALRGAEYQVQSTAFELEAARAALLETRGDGDASAIALRSPVDGVVLRRLQESETVVAPGYPILEIGDPRQLEVVADYLSRDAVRIRPGQSVLLEQWGGERPLQGEVRRVEPSGFMKVSALGVEEQRVNVVIDITDPSELWQHLGDGFRVEVRVVVWQEEEILKVPTSSLFRSGDSWAVFAVRDGAATLTSVEIGERNGLEAQLLSGLEAGDQVLVHASDAVTDGVAVTERG